MPTHTTRVKAKYVLGKIIYKNILLCHCQEGKRVNTTRFVPLTTLARAIWRTTIFRVKDGYLNLIRVKLVSSSLRKRDTDWHSLSKEQNWYHSSMRVKFSLFYMRKLPLHPYLHRKLFDPILITILGLKMYEVQSNSTGLFCSWNNGVLLLPSYFQKRRRMQTERLCRSMHRWIPHVLHTNQIRR